MLLTKELEIKLNSKTIKHYHDLGYVGKPGESIIVKVEDLTKGSRAKVDVLCDYCNNKVLTMQYKTYLDGLKTLNKTACKNCKGKKQVENNMLKYGVRTLTQLDEVKEKTRNTSLQKYGVTNYAKTEECIQKRKETNLQRYGVENFSQTKDFAIQREHTCIERYGENYGKKFSQRAIDVFYEKTGYDNPNKSPEVKQKTMQTCIKQYGVKTPSQLPEIREKIAKTLYLNSSQKCSKQQRYIYELYKYIKEPIELNFPIKYYSVDICFPKENLCVEVDCGGHNLQVKTGKLTKEEFDRKELIRNQVIKREGYKQMRIISSTDKLPSDEILLQMLEQAKKYFFETNHSWITYDIDNSRMINATNKDSDGVFFNFGELRRVKKSDIPSENCA